MLLLLLCYALLLGRLLYLAHVAMQSEQAFAAFIGVGASLWLGLQVIVNVGVNTGILPTKGLTLPFISYGGSSLLVCSTLIGLMFRMSREVRARRLGISLDQGTRITRY